MAINIPMGNQKIGLFAYESCREATDYETGKTITNDKGETQYCLICRFTPLGGGEAVAAWVRVFLPEKPVIGGRYPSLGFEGLSYYCWENGRNLKGYFTAESFKVLPDEEETGNQGRQQAAQQQAARTQNTRAAARQG